LLFQVVIDKVLVHKGLSTLDVLVIGFIAIALFETALGWLRTYVFSHTTNRVDVELGARLYRHVLQLPLSYFLARRVGDTVARVRELDHIREFLTGSALTLVLDLFFCIVFIAVMWFYSQTLTLIVLASIPLFVLLSAWATPIFRRRLDEKFKRGAENQAFLVESVTGIETVKALAVEPQFRNRWDEQLAGYVNASFKTMQLANTASQTAQMISKIVTAATLWVGAQQVIDGALTVGALVAFNMLSGRVMQPILKLVQAWQEFQQAGVSVERLGDVLNAQTEVATTPNRASLPRIQGRVALESVTFRYRPDAPEVLRRVSLDVPAGQVLGIVGPSGSGKSTLTKLVQRLHVPESGRVMVDGVDLALVDTAWLRRQIGVVLQESFLFNRTIRDNVALAEPGASMERVVNAAKLAGAHEFIVGLPEGYDTLVGERGGTLSGGQRQRIAIARALITDPRILILDEATSALDYESEKIIQENMARISQGRTVIVIAHRLSTVRGAHRIITIDKGEIVEDGTHAELLTRGGRYAQLHKIQAG
ncbi:MAG: type I secretion system permease/ATPase, partial [Alphaproteobacteria bacterium]|nr:type I secretion system permease/ATPase [Alphaproteobacteria bacterium]